MDTGLIKIFNDSGSYQILGRLKLIKEESSLIIIVNKGGLFADVNSETGINASVTIENSKYSINNHLPADGIFKSIAENKILHSSVKTNDSNFHLKSFQLKIK